MNDGFTHSFHTRKHFERALSERTARLCYLTVLWSTLEPDMCEWPLLIQEHLHSRPHHQSRRRREFGLSNPLHPTLLRDIMCDTDEHWQHRVFSCPLSRGNLVHVGSEFDRQVAHIHGPAILLQPETHPLLSHPIFCLASSPRLYHCSWTW
jgi:hypothetical protein